MDSLEQVVAELLWIEGYWVRTSVKVDWTKDEKRSVGLPSAPRWELDIVAYKAGENLLRIVECKSYLDSPGVALASLNGTDAKSAKRYKLFTNPDLRHVIFNRLALQFEASGACLQNPTIKFALACGRIKSDSDRSGLHRHFEQNGWDLWDEPWLRDRLKTMAKGAYENQVSAVVAKLLLRESAR